MPGASSACGGGVQGGGTKRKIEVFHDGSSPPSYTADVGGVDRDEEGSSGGEGSLVLAHAGGKEDTKHDLMRQSSAVVKMKADVFEKDRDNFLNAFEKPTQIYRFLRARMLESPIFLQRNLSYMRDRMSRSHKSRAQFRLDDILDHKMKCERKGGKLMPRLYANPRGPFGVLKTGPVKFYNIILMGFTDGQIWIPGTKAKVDIALARVCVNKRKEGPGPVSKIFEKDVDCKVFSPPSPRSTQEITIPYPLRCPVIAVPANLCTLGSNGHTVRSYKLVIRVTVPVKCLQQNGNNTKDQGQHNHLNNRNHSESSDEPKAKRRRSAPTTKDRENFIYDGESNSKTGNDGAGIGQHDKNDEYLIYSGNISLYEKDIPGDKIKEMDYDLVLKRAQRTGNKISHQRIRREISWECFDEKHSKVLEQSKPAGKSAKVSVAIRTSSEAVPSFVDPPPPLPCASVKNEESSLEKTSLVKQEMQGSVRVVYYFIHGSNSQQQTESRDDLRCPWCSLNCIQLYSLMKHLKLSHPRFLFSYSPILNGAKIDVTINDSFDGSYSGSAFDLVSQPPGEAFARNGPTKRTEVFSILVCRPKPFKQSLQEFFECDEKDVDQRRTYITGHNRLYHHTSTCLPIHPREIDVDSEGEPDPEWLRVKTTMMIDEFTDVNEGEKELMKLWNLHVMKYNYVGDCQIPFACKRFVELHGKELIHKNLYRNFCLHLTNLFDFGLLTPQGVHNSIQLLHAQMRESSTTTARNRDGWKPNLKGLTNSFNGGAVASEIPNSSALSFTDTCTTGRTADSAGGPSNIAATMSSLTPPRSNTTSPKTVSASSVITPASSNTATGNMSSHMNGGSTRKQEVKGDRSPTKKQTFFWLGGAYN